MHFLERILYPEANFVAQQTEAKTEQIRLIDNEHNFINCCRVYTKIDKKDW